MTPAEFLLRERDERELFDWLLPLIPPNSGGTSLTDIPPELRKQLKAVGIRGVTSADTYRAMLTNLEWAKDAYIRLIERMPENERITLRLSDSLAIGSINDAVYNGSVEKCEPGFAICVSTGALMLIGFAAELYCLNASAGLQRVVINGDYPFVSFQDRQVYRSMRAVQYVKNKGALGQLYPKQVGHELQFLFKNYAHLGVAGAPSFYKQLNEHFGYRPMFPEPSRFGHPLEAGSHLAEHALRFLLLHECGHILGGHFDGKPAHKQEFDADQMAFEFGVRSAPSRAGVVASLIGAWLVLAIARRVEAYGDRGARSSHPPASERLKKLFTFVSSTNFLGFFTRHRTLYYLRDLERRDAVLAEASKGYKQLIEDTNANTITLVVRSAVNERGDIYFIDQMCRWVLQFPPDRFFTSLAAARVDYERETREDPNDSRAGDGLKIIMKFYDAIGRHPESKLYDKLQNAYIAEVRRSA